MANGGGQEIDTKITRKRVLEIDQIDPTHTVELPFCVVHNIMATDVMVDRIPSDGCSYLENYALRAGPQRSTTCCSTPNMPKLTLYSNVCCSCIFGSSIS